MDLIALIQRAEALGLAVRGAFQPAPGEFDALLAGVRVGTIVLLGFTGSVQWQHFARSAEAAGRGPDPLDRWSRQVIGALAREFHAVDLYPNGATPQLPFQRLAARCEPVHPSPIGLLIHNRWGLWHAYRGALVLPVEVALPARTVAEHPCQRCVTKPCLSGCPVHAFQDHAFNVQACIAHLRSDAGADCREQGCKARRACPVGSEHRYSQDQQRFHMDAFRAAFP